MNRTARKANSQRSKSDARFAPFRDQAIAALKDDKLTFEEIRVECHAQPRHLYELAHELGIDTNERGKRVADARRKAAKIKSVNNKRKRQSKKYISAKISSPESELDKRERMEMTERSLSGDGMSLHWLRMPLVCSAHQ